MRVLTDHPTSRLTFLLVMVGAAAIGFLAILLLSHTMTTLIDAAVQLDLSVLAFLNRFARRSWTVDTLIWAVSSNAAMQSGAVMVIFWGAWFAGGGTPTTERKRETMLSSLIGVYACILLTLALRAALPFRVRPIVDPALAFQVPYLPYGVTLAPESTCFPSGHAAVGFALAAGLWYVSRTLGLLVALHSFFVVCLPRVYFGRHYATDILAGAVLAIAIVPFVNEILRRGPLVRRLQTWSDTHPAVFYSVLFLCSLDIATDFAYVRTLLHLVGSVRLARIVMLAVGVPVPS